MVTPTNLTIAQRVRAAMDQAGDSEVKLADDTGIPRTTLRRRLTGNSDWMTSELVAISKRLDVSLIELLADEAISA